ncbi:hypothetical protein [Thalassoroseus pseudoceratinae]|nr:hypothetical protein [Thalassoroseus pseudoceratinae]
MRRFLLPAANNSPGGMLVALREHVLRRQSSSTVAVEWEAV